MLRIDRASPTRADFAANDDVPGTVSLSSLWPAARPTFGLMAACTLASSIALNCETVASGAARPFLDAAPIELNRPATSAEDGAVAALQTLLRGIETESVEAGVRHPAEGDLRRYIGAFGVEPVRQWMYSEAKRVPVRAAEVVQLLGRVASIPLMQRIAIGAMALASSHPSLRDAGVSAIEQWGSRELASLLHPEGESVAWLRDYMACVAQDLAA